MHKNMVVVFRYSGPQEYTHVPGSKPKFKQVHVLNLKMNLNKIKILDPYPFFIDQCRYLRTDFHPWALGLQCSSRIMTFWVMDQIQPKACMPDPLTKIPLTYKWRPNVLHI